MPNTTTNMNLNKAIDGDDVENFLTVSDASDKDKIDAHQHGGGADGLAVKTVTATGRIQGRLGANIASANNVTLGLDGNIFSITGAVEMHLLDTTGWQAGSIVTLWFGSGITIKHNQAPSGAFLGYLLAGGVDFVAAAAASLTLFQGTTYWVEVARKA